MPAVALLSATGAPGVTTAAAALGAVAASTGGSALLAELDPSGGSVQAFTGRPAAPGLVDAAGRLRREVAGAALEGHVALLPDGLPTLLAPTAGLNAESVIDSAADRWMQALRHSAQEVFADAGRWSSTQKAARRIAGADLTLVVCRPALADVEAARHLLDQLREVTRQQLAALVVGNRPYPPEEVAAHLELPLAGTLAWDPRGAQSLWSDGVSRRWLRSRLGRSAVRARAGIAALAGSGSGSVDRGPTNGALPPPPTHPPPVHPPAPPAAGQPRHLATQTHSLGGNHE